MKKQDEEQLTLFPADSRANHSPWLEGREDEKTRDFYGLRCFVLSENLSRLGFLVKTYLESYELPGNKYVRNWQVRGTLLPFLILKLRLSVRRIGETESFSSRTENKYSLWLTPTASDGKRTEFSKEALMKGAEKGSLSQEIAHNDSGKGGLNPLWVEQLMGFPVGWTEVCDAEN